MELNYNDEKSVRSPDAEMIRKAVDDLPRDEFLVLGRANEEYIQVLRHTDDTFQLEYRAGSQGEHYGTDAGSTSASDVKAAFLAYWEMASPEWHSPWSWEKVEF